jgi:hypothetical protein
VRRLREALAAEKIAVEFENGAYRLRPGATGVRVPLPRREAEPTGPAERKLRKVFGQKPFAAGSAAKALDLPLRSAQRLFRSLAETGALERQGRGKSTRYRLSKV